MNAGRVAHHGLAESKRAGTRRGNIELVSQRGQFAANGFGNQRFNVYIATLKGTFREASGFQRLLDIEAVIGNVGDELGMSLRLIEPAHDPETNTDAVLFHECRDDRMQRPLARGQGVRMIRLHCEERASVVQDEAGSGRNDTGAEVGIKKMLIPSIESRLIKSSRECTIFIVDVRVNSLYCNSHPMTPRNPKREALPLPTAAEVDILAVLWRLGPATVREVHEQLGKDSGYTTTLKQMQLMTEKGLLVRSERFRSHVYEPAVPREQTQKQIAADLLNRVFDGSAQSLVMGALSAQPASGKELARIREMLEEFAKKKGRSQ